MTAQPTTPMPPFGPQDPHGLFAPQQPSAPQGFDPAGAPPLPPAPRRRTGMVVGIVAGALVLLAGLGTAALFLFAPRTVDPVSVQREIVRITQTAVQVAPTDVRCPDEIKAAAGGVFACTATVEQQPVTYTVRQDDAEGHLTITYDRLLKVSEVESVVAGQVGKDVEVPVTVTCEAAGRSVLVNAPGAPIACTATNADDPTDDAAITVTVAADGTPAYTFA